MLLTVPIEWWSLLVATLLPAAVALVRQRYASSRWGALLLLLLTVLSSLVAEIVVTIDGAVFSVSDVGKRFVLMFVVAVVAHYGLLKPAGVTGSQGVIAAAVPGGLGTPTKGVLVASQLDDGTFATEYEGKHERPEGGAV